MHRREPARRVRLNPVHRFQLAVVRIIGGRFRRRHLKSPPGNLTRPSTDRVREAIFNLLESRMDLDGARVLDLFSGTGALGLEALSRGAKSVTFVERSQRVLHITRENAALLEISDQCLFVGVDAVAFIRRYQGPPFDVVFADPPYDLDGLRLLPVHGRPHLSETGLFVLEHDVRNRFEDEADPPLVTRPYGRTIVTIFER